MDQHMMPSPQDVDSLGSSPDGLSHSMLSDINNSSSMDVRLLDENMPTSPVMLSNGNGMGGGNPVESHQQHQQQIYSPNAQVPVADPMMAQVMGRTIDDSPSTCQQVAVSATVGSAVGGGGKKYHSTTATVNNNNNNYMLMNNNNNGNNATSNVEYVGHHSPNQMMHHNSQQHQQQQVRQPSQSVKCEAELIHGNTEFFGGLRTSFKKEPEHRY